MIQGKETGLPCPWNVPRRRIVFFGDDVSRLPSRSSAPFVSIGRLCSEITDVKECLHRPIVIRSLFDVDEAGNTRHLGQA